MNSSFSLDNKNVDSFVSHSKANKNTLSHSEGSSIKNPHNESLSNSSSSIQPHENENLTDQSNDSFRTHMDRQKSDKSAVEHTSDERQVDKNHSSEDDEGMTIQEDKIHQNKVHESAVHESAVHERKVHQENNNVATLDVTVVDNTIDQKLEKLFVQEKNNASGETNKIINIGDNVNYEVLEASMQDSVNHSSEEPLVIINQDQINKANSVIEEKDGSKPFIHENLHTQFIKHQTNESLKNSFIVAEDAINSEGNVDDSVPSTLDLLAKHFSSDDSLSSGEINNRSINIDDPEIGPKEKLTIKTTIENKTEILADTEQVIINSLDQKEKVIGDILTNPNIPSIDSTLEPKNTKMSAVEVQSLNIKTGFSGVKNPYAMDINSLKTIDIESEELPDTNIFTGFSKLQKNINLNNTDALAVTPSDLVKQGISQKVLVSDKALDTKLSKLSQVVSLGEGDGEAVALKESAPIELASTYKTGVGSLFKTQLEVMHNPASARVSVPVHVSFGQPSWAGAIAERSAMMASQRIEMAEIQLDPPELGPLQVRVHVQHDQASVSFVSASAQVRESLEQASLRLKDILGEQGLTLVDVDVSDRQNQSNDDQKEGDISRKVIGNEDDDLLTTMDENQKIVTVQVNSGIDHFV